MNICDKCSNREICGSNKGECEHFNVSYTRSEVIDMVESADNSKKHSLIDAIEHVYRIKMAF